MSSKAKQKRKSDKPTNGPNNEEQNAATSTENEAQLEKFDHELTWCIEQLQLGLETQNPSSKQAQEATKILKILLSAKAPLIKKRQAMRNAFGDYRKKMADMEKKSVQALRKSKVAPVQSTVQKSQFFKKSSFSSKDTTNVLTLENGSLNTNQSSVSAEHICENQSDVGVSVNPVSDLSSNFQFGFKIDNKSCDENGTPGKDNGTSVCDLKNNSTKVVQTDETHGAYHKSDNSFRFGFAISEAD